MQLSAKKLNALKIPVPKYERSQIGIGIVHFGVGGFHRAHQVMYLDELLNAGLVREWGICGVGVLPGNQRMRDAHPDGTTQPRVIGSLIDFHDNGKFDVDNPAILEPYLWMLDSLLKGNES